MGWEGVDEGWGRKAVDFAYLFESQMWSEYAALLEACGVADDVDVLDVACGAGLAVRLASERAPASRGLTRLLG